jgi:hypothetical protein
MEKNFVGRTLQLFPGRMVLSVRFPESIGTKIQSEHITALCAEINFSDPTQNLKVIAVGRVFLNHSEKTV